MTRSRHLFYHSPPQSERMQLLKYQEVKKHADVLLSMTSLTEAEFGALLILFGNAWTKTHVPDQNGRGRPPIIGAMADRLLFILYYYKCYPTQEVIGYLFGVSQERACQYVTEFTQVLLLALKESGFAPERISEELKKSSNRLLKRISSSMEPNGLSKDQRTQKNKDNSTAERDVDTLSRMT
jgi:DDE superfamily endonuclease